MLRHDITTMLMLLMLDMLLRHAYAPPARFAVFR